MHITCSRCLASRHSHCQMLLCSTGSGFTLLRHTRTIARRLERYATAHQAVRQLSYKAAPLRLPQTWQIFCSSAHLQHYMTYNCSLPMSATPLLRPNALSNSTLCALMISLRLGTPTIFQTTPCLMGTSYQYSRTCRAIQKHLVSSPYILTLSCMTCFISSHLRMVCAFTEAG